MPSLFSPSPGKFSSDLSPAFLLNLPYLLIPTWAGVRLFQQPKALPCFSPEKVSWELGPGRGGLLWDPSASSPSWGWAMGCSAENVTFPSRRLRRSNASACTSGRRTWGWSWSCSSPSPSPSSGGW